MKICAINSCLLEPLFDQEKKYLSGIKEPRENIQTK